MMDVDADVAVVGIGCHFPGGEGLENFWQVLLHGKNCAVQIPNERFDISQWYDSDDSKAGKTYTAKAALIDGLNEFDHKFFGVTDAESTNMDPQHKLLLQCTYRALEDAGIPMEKASGTRTGVFLGLMNRDFELASIRNSPKNIDHTYSTGTAMSIAANRISYIFNFTGPSLSIDCACSSSLVALHFACQAMKQGDCEMAVCGGVTCILEPTVFVALSKAKMISPEGTSKPFSSKADGYGRGEGCGVVLLKPLRKALQDHDHIWGIISKTAVNQDGHTVSPITKPSMVQQEELLRKIYSTDTDLTSVQYVEAHGTGTPVGDPIEAGSISKVIARARPRESGPLLIGSVKSNIGHTESAAGVAGLIKILLMMKHETFVPSVFYSEENSSIDTKSLNLRIPTITEKWVGIHNAVRTAGVNNFGFGGTNAHAIIRQYVQPKKSRAQIIKTHQFFVLSAASEKSIKHLTEDTAKQISAGTISDLQSLLYTSACRRSHMKHKYRKVFQTSSLTDLKATLTAFLQKKVEPSKTDSKLVFVFCGNGVTYRGMCRHLLNKESVFREVIMKIETLMQNYTNLNLLEKLESESDDFSDPKVVQPLLFAIQVAVASLLKHWGVSPDVVLGHSIGEVAAAHCSGLLSLEDAVKIIHYRSLLQSTVTGGKMLAVSNMAVSEILKVLPSYSGKVCLAAYNSPQSCTLSGDADDIDRLHQNLSISARGKDLFLRILDVPAAYHSHKMDPIVSRVKENIGFLQRHSLVADLFSTVTGESPCSSDFTTGEYWARNIREPVAFEQAVRSAAKNKRNVIFVEIGPRRSLQRYITETLGNDITVLPSVQPEKDCEAALATVSKLFEHGVKVDWEMYYKGFETEPIPYPRYQFDNVKKIIAPHLQLAGPTSNHPVITQNSTDSSVFSCDLSSDSVAFLQDHKHNGVAILPGAFYAELGLAAFMEYAKPKVPLSSLQLKITFQSPFLFTQNAPDLKVQLNPSDNLPENMCNFKIQSTSAVYASGTVEAKLGRIPEEESISLDCIFKRSKNLVTNEEFYKHLSKTGFDYGRVFRNEADVYCGEEFKECISVVSVPNELLPHLHDYYIHPVVLDYVMQLILTTTIHDLSSRPQFPTQIGSLTVFEPLQEEMFVYLKAVHVEEDGFEICGCLTNKQGKVLVELRNVQIRKLGSRSRVVEEYFYHNSFSIISEDATLDTSIKALVFTDELGISKSLQKYLHPASKYISSSQSKTLLECGLNPVLSNLKISRVQKNFQEILFIWGDADLTSCKSEIILDSIAACCEIFRRIIVYLKADNFPGAIRVITYRSSEGLVDHISSGFVLLGMTRACAAELSELSFQLIDMDSVSSKDIRALVQVLSSYPCSKYPELVVQHGKILKPEITRTPLPNTESPKQSIHMLHHETFILQTSDPYEMTNISAIQVDNSIEPISGKHIEVQLSKTCVHSSDYFPVSISDFTYGQTMYWNNHTTQNHKILALDFSGVVTGVGKYVRKLKVGDDIVCCFPVTASSKLVLPAAVCYKAKKLSFLKDTPCVSFMVLAWEILHEVLPKVKQRKLGIFSTVHDSSLIKVLTAIAHRSGWTVKVCTQADQLASDFREVEGAVLIPPYDKEIIETVNNVTVIKDVVLVYDNQPNLPVDPKTFRVLNEVHIHYLFMSRIMQQWYLQVQMPQIYHWLKSMHLDRKSLSLDTTAFQKVKSYDIDLFSMKESESYFTHQILPIITLDNDAKNQLSDITVLPKQSLFQKGSVYIVTGGLTGLGFETVKFIAQKGGGNIVIFSRSNPNPQIQQEIQNISNNYGSVIKCLQCDVSLSEQVQQTIVQIGKLFPSSPIRGVFHSAVVLHDGLIESLDKSLYEKVMRPKVNGVINLHNATTHCNLDYFVCYSSISAFIGNASQTNYAAANSFMDTFCQYRRNIGLPGQSINWGALNLGLLFNKVHLQKFLEARGIMLMETPEIHESLVQCLLINKPQQAVCKFDFKSYQNNVLNQNKSLKMRLSKLIDEAISKDKVNLSGPEQSTPSSPQGYIRSMISETIGVDLDELNDDVHLVDLGVDSMLAMTLQNVIFIDKAVNVPLVTLLDPNSTLLTLIRILEGNSVGDFKSIDEIISTYL